MRKVHIVAFILLFSSISMADSLMALWRSRAQSGNWSPSEISTAAWYDAADTITLATNVSGRVSQWTDKSGNGNNMRQTTLAVKPTYISSDPLVNNLPSIYSENNVNELLQATNSFTFKRAYFVCYYGNGVINEADGHNAIFASADGDPRLTLRATYTHIWDNQDGKNFDLNGETYRNGSFINSAPPNALTYLPMPATLWRTTSPTSRTEAQWRLLGNTGSTWNSWWGGLSEMIFTDGTEDLETQRKIEGYLAWKWGLQGNLPSDHPYKNSSPKK